MKHPRLADVLPVHPSTGLTAIGMGKRGPIWPVMGGSPDDDGGAGGSGAAGDGTAGGTGTGGTGTGTGTGAGGTGSTGSVGGQDASGGSDESGFPANTPVAEMTAHQQAAYWKAQSRKHEGRAQRMADYPDLKKKAEEFDALTAASKTAHEKALEAAKAEGATEATAAVLQRVGGQLVEARIRTQVGARMTPEQLDLLLENLDKGKFLNAEHAVDADKVTAYVTGILPAQQGQQQQQQSRDLGQGRRQGGTGAATGTEAGRDLYRERHPRKTNA